MSQIKAFWAKSASDFRDGDLVIDTEVSKYLAREKAWCLLTGPRKSGKSTMLRELVRNHREHGKPAAYINFEHMAGLSKRQLEDAVFSEMAYDLNRQLNISFPSNISYNPLQHLTGEVTTTVCLDNFNYLAVNIGKKFLSPLRSLFEYPRMFNVRLVLADCTDPSDYRYDMDSPFEIIRRCNVFYTVDFSRKEADEFLIEGLRQNNIQIGDPFLSEIWNLTHGQPAIVQEIGSMLVQGLTKSDDNREVSEKQMAAVFGNLSLMADNGQVPFLKTLENYLLDGSKESSGNMEKILDRQDFFFLDTIIQQELSNGNRRMPFKLTGASRKLFSLGFIRPINSSRSLSGNYGLDEKTTFRNELVKKLLLRHKKRILTEAKKYQMGNYTARNGNGNW
jgi:GTPase SAR1 family protein